MARPPEIWSTVATCLANTPGFRKKGGVTSVPSPTDSVTAATAASWVQASRMGSVGSGTP